ncbi:hypothetical protein ACPOLB_24865 [Rubrivivax sp. RP6-9]|uniref:hypothetical protein n=1 Tax=Rubrivivax sp. RP6-9 TaxID=3415750 RepID=UPI003CC5A6D5
MPTSGTISNHNNAPYVPSATSGGAAALGGAAATGLATSAATAASIAASAGGAAMVGGSVGMGMDAGAMSAEAIMAKANDVQNKLAMASAANQVAGLVRSMMMQVLRDFIKDAKDTVKDQGEAGHKP